MYELDAKTLASNEVGGGVWAQWATEISGALIGAAVARHFLGNTLLNGLIGVVIGDAVGTILYNTANPNPVVVYLPNENREQQVTV